MARVTLTPFELYGNLYIWINGRVVAYPNNLLISNSRVIINNSQDILLRYLKLQLINRAT